MAMAAGLLVLGAPAAADVVRVRGVAFPGEVTVAETTLSRRGAGVLRYLGMVPVYVAGFYLDAGAPTADALGNTAKRLEVEYLVGAPAQRFNDAGERHLAATLSAAAFAALESRLAEIAAWYPDPQPGDRCALTYVPGRGTVLTFNGEERGVIPGEDFQRAYFSIWLGEPAASDGLRRALLGGR